MNIFRQSLIIPCMSIRKHVFVNKRVDNSVSDLSSVAYPLALEACVITITTKEMIAIIPYEMYPSNGEGKVHGFVANGGGSLEPASSPAGVSGCSPNEIN